VVGKNKDEIAAEKAKEEAAAAEYEIIQKAKAFDDLKRSASIHAEKNEPLQAKIAEDASRIVYTLSATNDRTENGLKNSRQYIDEAKHEVLTELTEDELEAYRLESRSYSSFEYIYGGYHPDGRPDTRTKRENALAAAKYEKEREEWLKQDRAEFQKYLDEDKAFLDSLTPEQRRAELHERYVGGHSVPKRRIRGSQYAQKKPGMKSKSRSQYAKKKPGMKGKIVKRKSRSQYAKKSKKVSKK
jgi:hypothetical protein